MSKTQSIRNKLEQAKGQKSQIEKTITSLKDELKDQKRSLIRHERAREVIREVGLKTQQSLQVHIGDIATLAMESVFEDPYQLQVEFVQRRNKTECDLYFVRNEEKIDPLTASGGGAVDVASFALRIASWSMNRPHTRPVIILDEPLRFLSVDLQERASIMIKEISKKLGLQFIIITHEQTLASYADRVFETRIRKGITKVTQS
jgi:DNA repair exonuclease SbcCD ATPase subunit